MEKYHFQLVKAYSHFNKVVVVEQKGASICFMIPYYENQKLKKSLKSAFCRYLDFVQHQEDCPEVFKREPKVRFVYGSNLILSEKLKKEYVNNGEI